MAAVYKSFSKVNSSKSESSTGVKKNRQRVLILSSRGVTYRYMASASNDTCLDSNVLEQ